jgi:hypothetical protein
MYFISLNIPQGTMCSHLDAAWKLINTVVNQTIDDLKMKPRSRMSLKKSYRVSYSLSMPVRCHVNTKLNLVVLKNRHKKGS